MRSLNKAEGWEQPGGAGAGPWGVRGEQGSSDAHGEVVCVEGELPVVLRSSHPRPSGSGSPVKGPPKQGTPIHAFRGVSGGGD